MHVSIPAARHLDDPMVSRAVHLADRLHMDWADFLYLLDLVERYLTIQDSGAPPPKAL